MIFGRWAGTPLPWIPLVATGVGLTLPEAISSPFSLSIGPIMEYDKQGMRKGEKTEMEGGKGTARRKEDVGRGVWPNLEYLLF